VIREKAQADNADCRKASKEDPADQRENQSDCKKEKPEPVIEKLLLSLMKM
jgi:hypothetical protein